MKTLVRSLLRSNRSFPELTFADYVAERVGIWSEAPAVPGAIVFLGDSQIERGRWNEWWTHHPVLNRGIGGETVEGVHARLDEVVRHSPALVVVECGTNDLAPQTKTEVVASRYKELLHDLRKQLPNSLVWVQGVLPVHPSNWRDLPLTQANASALERNAQVRELNRHLAALAREENIPFLDLHPFLEEQGMLRAQYTLDGLHLNGTGYRVWRETLRDQAPPQVATILERIS